MPSIQVWSSAWSCCVAHRMSEGTQLSHTASDPKLLSELPKSQPTCRNYFVRVVDSHVAQVCGVAAVNETASCWQPGGPESHFFRGRLSLSDSAAPSLKVTPGMPRPQGMPLMRQLPAASRCTDVFRVMCLMRRSSRILQQQLAWALRSCHLCAECRILPVQRKS